MVVVLEGIADGAAVVLLCLAVILLGLAGVWRAITDMMANAIPSFSILGHDITSWIRRGIRASGDIVYHWALTWYHANVHVVVALFRGTAWSIRETIDAVTDTFDAVAHGIHRILAHYIPAAIHALRVEVQGWIHDVRGLVHDLRVDLTRRIGEVAHDLHALAERVPHLIASAIHEFNVTVVRPLERFAHELSDFVRHTVFPRLQAAEHWISQVGAEFSYAAQTIEGVLPRLPSISFDDLNDFINKLPWRRIGGLLTFGFLTHALLKALTREAGLDRPECRRKVKGICGTDMQAWENLLAGLVAGLALDDFPELARMTNGIVDELRSEFVDYAHRGEGK